MVKKYIIDKTDLSKLIQGEELALTPCSKYKAFCIEINGKLTNGDVIKAMFPNIITEEFATIMHTSTKVTCCGDKHCNGAISYDFWKEWWNAPFKPQESEEV